MKLTQARISRYLAKQKQINDYLLKIRSRDRSETVKMSNVMHNLLAAEEGLRELNESLVS